MNILQELITILSLLAAVLAWLAKLFWSKEYSSAKDAQIEVLREQLDFYQNLTPPKLLEYISGTNELIGKIESDFELRIAEIESERHKLLSTLDNIEKTKSQEAANVDQYETHISQLRKELAFVRSERNKLERELSDPDNTEEYQKYVAGLRVALSQARLFSKMIRKGQVAFVPVSRGDKDAIKKFLLGTAQGGTISEKVLSMKINSLEEGSYVFLWALHRPKGIGKAKIDSIANFFGKQVWHQSMWVIKPINELEQVQNYVPKYIIGYRFEV